MRKGLVTIIAVAIIGALGIYTNGHKAATATAQGSTSSVSATPISSASQDTTNPAASGTPSTTPTTGSYIDGTYTGSVSGNEYGPIQVAAVISGGKIVDVKFLQMPSAEGHSREITAFAESPLRQSAIAKQSAHIDFVSGATSTSQSYEVSLQAALDQAA